MIVNNFSKKYLSKIYNICTWTLEKNGWKMRENLVQDALKHLKCTCNNDDSAYCTALVAVHYCMALHYQQYSPVLILLSVYYILA